MAAAFAVAPAHAKTLSFPRELPQPQAPAISRDAGLPGLFAADLAAETETFLLAAPDGQLFLAAYAGKNPHNGASVYVLSPLGLAAGGSVPAIRPAPPVRTGPARAVGPTYVLPQEYKEVAQFQAWLMRLPGHRNIPDRLRHIPSPEGLVSMYGDITIAYTIIGNTALRNVDKLKDFLKQPRLTPEQKKSGQALIDTFSKDVMPPALVASTPEAKEAYNLMVAQKCAVYNQAVSHFIETASLPAGVQKAVEHAEEVAAAQVQLQKRIGEIRELMGKSHDWYETYAMAAVRTKDGQLKFYVASKSAYGVAAVNKSLGGNEELVGRSITSDLHAEMLVQRYAESRGEEILGIGATRPVCKTYNGIPWCQSYFDSIDVPIWTTRK